MEIKASHKIHQGHPKADVGDVADAASDTGQSLANGVSKGSFIQNIGGWSGAGIIGAQFLTPAAKAFANIAATLGKWTKFKPLEEAGTNAGAKITELSEVTIGQVAKKIPGSEGFGKAASSAANYVGGGLDRAANTTGFSGIAPKISNWNLERHEANLAKGLKTVKIGDLPQSAQSHARSIIDNISKGARQVDVAKFESAGIGYAKALEGVTTSDTEKAAVKEFAKVVKTASKAVASHTNATSLGSIGSVVKQLPGNLAKSQVIPGVMNTAFIGMSAAGMFGVAKGFKANLDSLKEMASDISGKPVSTFQILTGDVPKPVAEARSNLLKNFGVSEAVGAAGLVASVLMAARGKVGMMAFMAPQAVGMAAGALIGESTLPYYTSLKAAHKGGEKIPPEAYADFIAKASPELRMRGGADNAFAKKLAEKYSQENVSPEEIMRRVAKDGLKGDITALIQENEATKHMAEPQKSHVAALTEPAINPQIAEKDRPKLGKYTTHIAEATTDGPALRGA